MSDQQTQAVLLLTAHLGRSATKGERPLTPTEWGRFALWLHEHDLKPEDLLQGDPARFLQGWHDERVTCDRVRFLLGRAGALGLALERWERAGLWVLTRGDPHYPERLKRRLGAESPAFLFGCGERDLLHRGGFAVLGSRDATPDDLALTARIGELAAGQGVTVISGGARGVDETALVAAISHGGTAVGVLADSLLRAATSKRYREGLMGNQLVLVSTSNPEAGFDVGTAMGRNKYLYCLAHAAIVVTSARDQGGTWAGAKENLHKGWVPLYVAASPPGSGNAALVERGARWLPEAELDFATLAREAPVVPGVGAAAASPPVQVPLPVFTTSETGDRS
jgi:predicted Rossmann fold nucleotide-binding protein DprA/Smf involved in DNA uptake